jgi:hypothetical protein
VRGIDIRRIQVKCTSLKSFVCIGERTCRSLEVIRDRPSSRGTSGARSTTSKFVDQERAKSSKSGSWSLIARGLHVNKSSTSGGSPVEGVRVEI